MTRDVAARHPFELDSDPFLVFANAHRIVADISKAIGASFILNPSVIDLVKKYTTFGSAARWKRHATDRSLNRLGERQSAQWKAGQLTPIVPGRNDGRHCNPIGAQSTARTGMREILSIYF